MRLRLVSYLAFNMELPIVIPWCREGMKKAGVQLLEPIMSVEVITPEDHMGDVIGNLNARRGVVQEFLDKPGGVKVG